MPQFIEVKGARVNNLKNVSVKIPRDKLTVLTGTSGSGKSSLAFDTIFAEGQRRYVESLSSYARQFLGVIEKPDVDEITGLSPALAIDQKSASRSPRSTVGTLSEIYDYLRLLWTAVGRPACAVCGKPMKKITFATARELAASPMQWRCEAGHSAPEITISTFSFNSPAGACPDCQGLGKKLKVVPSLVVPNPKLTLNEGAIRPWTRLNAGGSWHQKILTDLASVYQFSLDEPFYRLPPTVRSVILHGSAKTGFEGAVANLQSRHEKTDSEYVKREIEKCMVRQTCSSCGGARLKNQALTVTVAQKNIAEASALPITELCKFTADLESEEGKLNPSEKTIAGQVIREIMRRLNFLIEVGLGYLALNRPADTLAGGEAQRIRLATQLGSQLMGVVYILDEPSIGLHPRDQNKLLTTLKELRDIGNTVVVVEHDRPTIEAADYIIDVGPGGGDMGGEIVAAGTYQQILASPKSITGKYLAHAKRVEVKRRGRHPRGHLIVEGARQYNLKNITAAIPTDLFVCVTGVSGSGKSTLVTDILAAALKQHFYRSNLKPGLHEKVKGIELISKVIEVDQSPIGRTPRSNPATYTGVFGRIRNLFAETAAVQKRRFTASHFSFNLRGGRCEACRGDGVLKVEMHFLPTVYVRCEVCGGRRYSSEILEISCKGKSIADVLDMTVDEAAEFFGNIGQVNQKLQVLKKVGLGYLRLGQPATTLSGGEAQRIKLAAELARPQSEHSLYILDEPTTGLHFDDIKKLLEVLHGLVDKGNTVVVVEHNLDVIKNADWVIDLGPEGGEKGGYIVAQGTPGDVAKVEKSYTGQFLKKVL